MSEWRKDQVKYSDRLRPVLVPAGALGPDVPECDLYVSPQHRLLIQSTDAICGTTQEVFASAKHLVGHNGIAYSPKNDGVEYYHIWLGKHEIIKSNGAYTESFFPEQWHLTHLNRHSVGRLRKPCLEIIPLRVRICGGNVYGIFWHYVANKQNRLSIRCIQKKKTPDP